MHSSGRRSVREQHATSATGLTRRLIAGVTCEVAVRTGQYSTRPMLTLCNTVEGRVKCVQGARDVRVGADGGYRNGRVGVGERRRGARAVVSDHCKHDMHAYRWPHRTGRAI